MEFGKRPPVDWDAIKSKAQAEGKITVVDPVDPDSVRKAAEQPVEGAIGNKSKKKGGGRTVGLDTKNPIKWPRGIGKGRQELINTNARTKG